MGFFSFKRRLPMAEVVDTLYTVVFRAHSDAICEYMHEGVVDKAVLDNPDTGIKLKFECDALAAFLVAFLFRRACESSGIDQAKDTLILDRFHDKLLDNLSEAHALVFRKLLTDRYAEYYPVMIDDLRWLKMDTGGRTYSFRGITQSFFNKIAPDKLVSVDYWMFTLTFAKLYSINCKAFEDIKNYKIG